MIICSTGSLGSGLPVFFSLAAEAALATEGGCHATGDWEEDPDRSGKVGAMSHLSPRELLQVEQDPHGPDARVTPGFPPRKLPCMGAERWGVE